MLEKCKCKIRSLLLKDNSKFNFYTYAIRNIIISESIAKKFSKDLRIKAAKELMGELGKDITIGNFGRNVFNFERVIDIYKEAVKEV